MDAPVSEYEERAGRYWKLDVSEVEAGAPGSGSPADRVKDAEAERILARIPSGFTGVSFVLGGAFGLSPRVLERAERRISLSPMTLPHEMARLVLAEQLYRAGTILRGEPYHKGA